MKVAFFVEKRFPVVGIPNVGRCDFWIAKRAVAQLPLHIDLLMGYHKIGVTASVSIMSGSVPTKFMTVSI